MQCEFIGVFPVQAMHDLLNGRGVSKDPELLHTKPAGTLLQQGSPKNKITHKPRNDGFRPPFKLLPNACMIFCLPAIIMATSETKKIATAKANG
jgi:hypothetical protein